MFNMFKKMICLVSFVLVLFLAGSAQAVVNPWNNDNGTGVWNDAGNWDFDRVPDYNDGETVNILLSPGPSVQSAGMSTMNMSIKGVGGLTIDGGDLTVKNGINVGRGGTDICVLTVNSGTLTIVEGNFRVPMGGRMGTFTMNGGLAVLNKFDIAYGSETIGVVNLHGGIVTANNFEMRRAVGSVGTMDVRGGTLIIDGDKLSLVQGYIDNGWITTYDGQGTLLLDYDATNEGKTTLKASHLLNPNPADGGTVGPDTVELSWTPRDPCVPGQPVPVDVYFTDNWEALYSFTDPAAIQIVSHEDVNSIVVQIKPKTRYYWAVDCYVGDPNDPVFGPLFSFVADNIAPRVNVGPDITTWLVDDVMTKNLDATVTDEDACTVQWTVVSAPDGAPAPVIQTPTAEDTAVTFSATGQYVLQLDASDGEYAGSDTVTINVYNDGCEAAQSLPGYVPLVGDLNGDCMVNDVDLALLQENWLKDNSLTEP